MKNSIYVYHRPVLGFQNLVETSVYGEQNLRSCPRSGWNRVKVAAKTWCRFYYTLPWMNLYLAN